MKIVIILSVLALLAGCTTRWTEKQKEEFAEKCSKTDSIDGLTFFLTGFDYDEIKNIMIKRIHNGQIVDSFYLQPPPKITFDSIRTRYLASIDRSLYLKDSFQFVIQGHEPFFLSDMEVGMKAQFTMFSEGYGCGMRAYKINGVRFEGANPNFIRKGFKYPWEKE